MSTLIEHLQDLKAFHDKRDRPEYQALIWAMVGAHLDELIGMVEELDRLRSAPYSWAREAAHRPEEKETQWPEFPSAMKDYRKKPVVVQAIQWFDFGDHPAVVPFEGNARYADIDKRKGQPWIPTLEGGHFVTAGDWIITGVKGENYPCKPEVFEQTYEPVSASSPPSAIFCPLCKATPCLTTCTRYDRCLPQKEPQ